MGYFDYSREPKSDIAFVDMKSFLCQCRVCEKGLASAEDLTLCHESRG